MEQTTTERMKAQANVQVDQAKTELRDLHCLMQAVTETVIPDSVSDYLWRLMNEREEYLWDLLQDGWAMQHRW